MVDSDAALIKACLPQFLKVNIYFVQPRKLEKKQLLYSNKKKEQDKREGECLFFFQEENTCLKGASFIEKVGNIVYFVITFPVVLLNNL